MAAGHGGCQTAKGSVTGAGDPPLSALLSQALVAFTIEFDNEFEHRMPHRTTRYGGTPHGPWLTSMAMYLNCMRFVGDEGIRVGELVRRARTKTNFRGMARWGYVTIKPDPRDARPKPPASSKIVRSTENGRRARDTWAPLFAVIETRWRERFGEEQVEGLRNALRAVVRQFETPLPDSMPILGYGLFSAPLKVREAGQTEDAGDLPLACLLSRALLAFAMEFESEAKLSLAVCADLLRVLDEEGVRQRDLPLRSGVSKEAISVALGLVQKSGLATVGATVVRLTKKGREAQRRYEQLTRGIEESWRARFGVGKVRGLRNHLERLAGDGTATRSPLFGGLTPYPDGWRAKVHKPMTLPHYPMTLHRGGFPDGS